MSKLETSRRGVQAKGSFNVKLVSKYKTQAMEKKIIVRYLCYQRQTLERHIYTKQVRDFFLKESLF